MNIKDFDYELPKDLIAQRPLEERDQCKLMVLNSKNKTIEQKKFYDVIEYLNEGDCLVLNDSKVIPARIFGTKESTGAKVEFLLIKRLSGDIWETMVRPGKKLKVGDTVSFTEDGSFRAVIKDYGEDGTRHAEFIYDGIFLERLEEIGQIPLPPYIERTSDDDDKDMYQTVYANQEGSVAAPTAGLHFTEELLQKAKDKGVKIARVTLHVGIGTFRPVKVENIEDHHMHFEEYSVSEEAAQIVNETIERGGRIISVGTTSSRTLESAAVFDEEKGRYFLEAGNSATEIFIYPGYKFKLVDGLITNFHLPKSTLLMLISAFYDREEILKAYELAVKEKYRFFSYGDAMLII